jgi:hypothetical protein
VGKVGKAGTVLVSVRRLWAAVVLLGVAGCAHSSNGSGSASALGTVTGVVRTYGGPLMPNGKMAADGSPTSGVTVTATQAGKTVASTVTGADGGYRFALPPGSYVVTGCSNATVVASAGLVVHQDLRCDVP